MVPLPLIMLLFFAAFILTTWQYYQIDPKRRILNLRFGIMVAAVIVSIGYPVYNSQSPGDRRVSWLLLVLGVVLVAAAYHLLRRMPPRETY